MPKKIIVQLGERSYPILIAQDRFRALGLWVRKLRLRNEAFVIANPDAKRHYGHLLKQSLNRAGIRAYFAKKRLPTGKDSEKAKSQKYVEALLAELIAHEKKGKRPFLIAFSGGVLGDLTGYIAATYKRGIPYIQVPTTLLAQVDSSIGGKVGIDHPRGKNLLGAFYQPRLVYSDLTVLEKLPKENLVEGLAEAVKCGVIADPKLFRFLERHRDKILGKDKKALVHVISTCAKIKANLVSQDERDNRGKRVLLNFGHTVGHAIEQASGYRERHGRAISVGMLCEAEIALRLGLFKKQDLLRLDSLLSMLGLPTTMKGVSLKRLFRAESLDKKFIHGKNRYVLPVRIGKVVVREGIPYDIIRQAVRERLS